MRIPAIKTTGLVLIVACLSLSGYPGMQTAPSGGTWNPAFKFKENEEIPEAVRQETFKLVWETVRDEYYDPTFGGKDWDAIGAKYKALAADVKKSGEFHSSLGKMVAELGRSHLSVTPPHVVWHSPKPGPEARLTPAGVALCVAEGRIAVYSVAPDSPAWSAGLRPGAILTRAGEARFPTAEEIRRSTMRALFTARRALAGPAEKPAELAILDENDREKTISVPRTVPYQDQANLGKSVFEHRRVHPRVGYIRFDGWAFDLTPKLEAAMKDLGDSDGIIIDCRQNRGGANPGVDYLSRAFCAEPGLLAVVTPRKGGREEWKHEGGGAAAYKGRVAILVDDGSGSASEAFAGAMQEKGRAVILGHTSYGGVLNSTQFPLPTGGILQYPHSDMRTPKGKAIEGIGVIPDIPVEMTRADLLRGKDTVIERAIAAILAGSQQ